MAYSKVIYGGKTLIDLTSDTVTADKLLTGITAHGADGELVTGTCSFDSNTTDANAKAAEILAGKTAYVNKVKVTGTMTNRGAVTGTVSTKDGQFTIPQGFHDGSGNVGIDPAEKTKLIPENIRDGITILGIEGTMSGTEDAKPQSKTVTPSTEQQVVHPDTESGYNFLSQVTILPIPYEESENVAGGMTVTIG